MCAVYAYAFQRISKASWKLRDKVCVAIPAILFAGFMVVGYSFSQINSLGLILKDKVQIAKGVIAFAGYGIGFMILIAWFYTWLTDLKVFYEDEHIQKKGLLGYYKALLVKFPFWTVFLTLIVVYIPYIILSYPAIVQGDIGAYVLQGFNLGDGTSGYLSLIDENVKLNGHHPVLYTQFIHVCLVIGKSFFGSYNVGLFLAAFSQFLAVCAVLARAIQLLSKMKVQSNILVGIILYFAFAPRMQNYMFLLTKDIFAACMLLLFLMSVFSMTQGEVPKKRTMVEIILFGIGVALFRNEGKYIILSSIIVMLFLVKEHKKTLLTSGVVIAVILGLFFHVLMPALHITPASRREALSVPFQQTARYFRECRDEITEEELEAVSAVLDVNSIGEKYDPNISDPVKETFNEDAKSEELTAYFKVWLKMGLKHPKVYIQATINNYYNYFYPGATLAGSYGYSWSENRMEDLNNIEDLKKLGCSFHYPKTLDHARMAYEALRECIFELPVFSLLRNTAVYVWLLVLLVFYCIKRKIYKGLALTTPLILTLGVCILAPCNGEYFRYFYSVSVCLPIVFLQCLYLCKCPSGRLESEPVS